MYPVIDLHCDLLAYLAATPGASPDKGEDIGCATPHLRQGGVRLQVLAAYVPTEANSVDLALAQCDSFGELLAGHADDFAAVGSAADVNAVLQSDRTGVAFAVENASGLCTEADPIDLALERLDTFSGRTGKILYISMTHNTENRFGGGNQTDVGLRDDGRVLLEYLHGKRIAVDLSHASDRLARGILEHIDARELDVPLLASHSNFRAVQAHDRNLPDELAREIVDRGGVIGMNLMRAFVNPEDPSALTRHVLHGLEIGAGDALGFGADFFCSKGLPDLYERPFYHDGHEHAGRYPQILRSLEPELGPRALEALAHGNAARFLRRLLK